MRCSFSPRAECDLEEIGDYIARDNPGRAYSFVEEIRGRCFAILDAPQGFPLREELGAGIRFVSVGRYQIYYTVHEPQAEVRIERILHMARDTDSSAFH